MYTHTYRYTYAYLHAVIKYHRPPAAEEAPATRLREDMDQLLAIVIIIILIVLLLLLLIIITILVVVVIILITLNDNSNNNDINNQLLTRERQGSTSQVVCVAVSCRRWHTHPQYVASYIVLFTWLLNSNSESCCKLSSIMRVLVQRWHNIDNTVCKLSLLLHYGSRRIATNKLSMRAARALGGARRSQSKRHGAGDCNHSNCNQTYIYIYIYGFNICTQTYWISLESLIDMWLQLQWFQSAGPMNHVVWSLIALRLINNRGSCMSSARLLSLSLGSRCIFSARACALRSCVCVCNVYVRVRVCCIWLVCITVC